MDRGRQGGKCSVQVSNWMILAGLLDLGGVVLKLEGEAGVRRGTNFPRDQCTALNRRFSNQVTATIVWLPRLQSDKPFTLCMQALCIPLWSFSRFRTSVALLLNPSLMGNKKFSLPVNTFAKDFRCCFTLLLGL